mgnify:FL=1|tara:strand:- start:767 stop:1318 length:552 start_codon:yes stop_codon:yes gene_type:complete
MSLKTLIVNHKHLYEILNEISSQINFNVINGFEKGLNKDDYKSYLVINTKEEEEIKDQLLINNFPIKMKKLVEIININFLKKNYNFQSNIKIGEYKLDLNSRILYFNKLNLNLTEMEANIILFLKNSSNPSNIKELQKKVWRHVPDLETHTVETHIYRLRKKIKEKFNDENFINSTKNGYEIK